MERHPVAHPVRAVLASDIVRGIVERAYEPPSRSQGTTYSRQPNAPKIPNRPASCSNTRNSAKQAKAEPRQDGETVTDAWSGRHCAPLGPKGHHTTTSPIPWGQHRYPRVLRRLDAAIRLPPTPGDPTNTKSRLRRVIQGAYHSQLHRTRSVAVTDRAHRTTHTASSAGTVLSPSRCKLHRYRGDRPYPRSPALQKAARPIFWRSYAASGAKRRTGCHTRESTTPSQQQVQLRKSELPTTPGEGVPTDPSGAAGAGLIACMRLLPTDERVPYILPYFRRTKFESARAFPHDHCAPQERPHTGRYLLAIMARRDTGGPEARTSPARASYGRQSTDALKTKTREEKFDNRLARPEQSQLWILRLRANGQRFFPPKEQSNQQRMWAKLMTQPPHASCGMRVNNSGSVS